MMLNCSTLVCSLVVFLSFSAVTHAGVTSSYTKQAEPSEEMPLETFPPPAGLNAPEQVHITQGDHAGRGMIISWVTPLNDDSSNVVRYWIADSDRSTNQSVEAFTTSYNYYDYTSGFLHHATIKGLEYDTKYYYELGTGRSVREFSFITPPKCGPDVPNVNMKLMI